MKTHEVFDSNQYAKATLVYSVDNQIINLLNLK